MNVVKSVAPTWQATGYRHTPAVSEYLPITPNRINHASTEVFGPVIISQANQAPRTANAVRHELASSGCTKDTSTLMKGSGTGCDMSVYALDGYTSVRHVMVAH
ncbi:hypothetical protein [Ruegeria sp.]|uniref:hypothetical protein n=1 Tax=Ruegeria sp. TaxID=1879320 RepID=UPI003C79F9E5